MKISFIGSHSTGKTTLLEELTKQDKYKNFFINTNISRTLKEQGFKINKEGDDISQLSLVSVNLNNLLSNKDVLSDRSLLDMLCYTDYLYKENKINSYTFQLVKNITKMALSQYDILYYIKPEFDLVADGVRDEDKQYQQDIADLFEIYINEFNDDLKDKIIILSGTVEERLKKIKETEKF